MKKALLLSVLTLLISFPTFSQEEFDVGDNLASIGIGLGSNIGSFTSGSQTPAISLMYERGLWEAGGPGIIGLGGYIGYKSYSYEYFGGESTWNYTIVGIRGIYHFQGFEVEDLDVYGGIMLSYNFLSYSGVGSYGGTGGFTGFIGGRWFFSESFGAFAELGYGVAYLNLGVTLKF